MNELQRIHDLFAHVGMAVALAYASKTIANMYQMPCNLQLPLPPYPGNYIHVVGALH
jgi:hypothetical protein